MNHRREREFPTYEVIWHRETIAEMPANMTRQMEIFSASRPDRAAFFVSTPADRTTGGIFPQRHRFRIAVQREFGILAGFPGQDDWPA